MPLIYIPICFYYFEIEALQNIEEQIDLHSNMFLLFPVIATAVIATAVIFTFQYVSIISSASFLAIITAPLFTFQYVSIISPSNVALYNSTTILPSFVDPVIIFCFFKKIFSFFPKLCIFPAKRQLSTPRLFYLITDRQFSFYMNSPSVSNSSCIISPMPFPVSNSNSYLYVALWISITFRFLPLPIVFLSTFSGNF